MKSRFRPSVALQLRLPVELREKLEKIKEETGKSVNQIIIELVENYLDEGEANDEAPVRLAADS